jgi:hypothetical protein
MLHEFNKHKNVRDPVNYKCLQCNNLILITYLFLKIISAVHMLIIQKLISSCFFQQISFIL